jgi:signal transduction histidine kinase
VRRLAAEVAERDAFERAGLEAAGLPAEVAPLVDEINRLLARQNAAAQRQRQFVADAAHALRTPLAALQLQADVLEGAADPQDYAARFADLRAGIRRAGLLSEQLLQIAHRAPTDAPEQPLQLDGVLREVVDLYQPAAATAGVNLKLQAHSQASIRTSSRTLLLIFGNLLDNALRFTPARGTVELRAQSSDGTVRIEVQDEGPGMPAAELTRVFEPFYRAAGDRSGGSGLGLATVASLVRELGGQIRLYNREDRSGLLACVSLPLRT